MNILKKLMQRLCGCGKHDGREHGQSLTAQLRLGPADILESDENGIIPEQARVITQVVILDADKKQIQCVVKSGSGFCCHVREMFVMKPRGNIYLYEGIW
ncbi:phage tail fiber C-terminal domain-containing protein [Escherichia coli]|uniref:phage tail fiber C-terminal domain-containing protein n=1 Tax=Escherichia coli TaxID=562 RepID=UPI0020244FF5|nr:phage tail fiber C-terminal domain-containing protein [Escherichia coli]